MDNSANKTLRSRILNGTFWNFIATISGQGSTFLIGIIIARLLKFNEYGEYAIILSTLLSLAGIVQLSIGQTVTKYTAEFRSVDASKSGKILGLCFAVSIIMACFGAIVLILSAQLISTYALNAPHLSRVLVIGVGFMVFSVINGYQMGVLAGLEEYRPLAKAGIYSAMLAIAFIAFGAWSYNLEGAIAALSLSAFMRFLLHFYWLKRALASHHISLIFHDWSSEKRIILHFALPAAAAGLYSIPAIWLANSILVRQPDGYAQMALFGAAFSLRTFVLFVPNVFNTVGLSILNHLKGNNQVGHYQRVFITNVTVIFLLTTLAVLFVGMLGEFGLAAFGKKFIVALPVLWVLLFATIPESLIMGLSQYLQSQEKIWLVLLSINVPRETLLVVFAYLLIPQYGALGLAYSYLVVYLFALLVLITILAVKYRAHKLRVEFS